MGIKLKPEACVALATLRRIAGWLAKDLAAAAGLRPSSISDYERGDKIPSRRTLLRFANLMGLPDYMVDRVLAVVREGRAAIATQENPADRLASTAQTIEQVSAEGASAASGFTSEVLTDLADRMAGEEDRRRAREAWEALSTQPTGKRRLFLSETPEAKTWALCEVVCDASVRAAADDATKAIELAELAVWIAGGVTGGDATRRRSQGYSLAFLGSARRVNGDLNTSEATFLRSHKLWRSQGPGLFDPSRVLDLEASLRRAQRRLPEAFNLLDRARAIAASPTAIGRILIIKAKTLEETAAYESALATLHEAERYVLEAGEPHQLYALRFNTLVNLCNLHREAEAAPGLPEVRALARRFENALGTVRLRWLEGRIEAGLGRTGEAMTALMEVRGALATRGLWYDVALVSLELAELYAAEGRMDAVKTLARQMASVFQAEGVHSEAKKALAFFRRAAEREEVTLPVARSLSEYLYRAKHDPELCFQAA